MEKNEPSSSDRGGQEIAPDLSHGRMINGAYFSDEEVTEFSEQNFLEAFDRMEDELLPRINAVRFVQRYLPIIMDHRGEDDRKEAPWLNMWRKEINENIRLGIVLVDDNGKEEYRLPPPVGTIHTSNTGHADSIEGRYAYMVMERRRLTSAGKFVEARMFNNIQIETEQNKTHQDDLLRLMADAGHLSEFSEAAKLYRSDKPTSVTRHVAANGTPVIPGDEGHVVTSAPATDAPSGDYAMDGDAGEMDYD